MGTLDIDIRIELIVGFLIFFFMIVVAIYMIWGKKKPMSVEEKELHERATRLHMVIRSEIALGKSGIRKKEPDPDLQTGDIPRMEVLVEAEKKLNELIPEIRRNEETRNELESVLARYDGILRWRERENRT